MIYQPLHQNAANLLLASKRLCFNGLIPALSNYCLEITITSTFYFSKEWQAYCKLLTGN